MSGWPVAVVTVPTAIGLNRHDTGSSYTCFDDATDLYKVYQTFFKAQIKYHAIKFRGDTVCSLAGRTDKKKNGRGTECVKGQEIRLNRGVWRV